MVFLIVCISIVMLIPVGIAMYFDWDAGARQSYIHEDGTIREWDRFGNVATVHPDGSTTVHIEDKTQGLGPLYCDQSSD